MSCYKWGWGYGGSRVHYTCTIILMKELKKGDTDQEIIMGLVISDGNTVTRLHVSINSVIIAAC